MSETKKVTGIKVKGIGKYVPEMIASNEDFAKIVDTSDEWITQRTGIKTRHITNGEPTYWIGAEAAKKAIADAGIDVSEIDLIICATVTPDFYTPSTACLIQREIGAIGSMAIDINCACTGFDYGLDMARRYLLSEDDVNTVLLVSAEELSKFTDYTDRSSCILFGDGAAAFVLERKYDALYSAYLGADGSGAKFLVSRAMRSENVFRTNKEDFDMGMPETKLHYFTQDGKEVYKFATKALPLAVTKACEKAGISPEDLDAIVPHQANVRIIETAAKNLGVSMDKMVVYIDRYGNTSSASIPIAFCDAVAEGRIKRGDKICFVGFGGGLTYAGIIFEY
ncbi:beta-ketoacyl-ACP synthase III [Ruminococcus albus]|uniref:Beta-ketoacyl-[acyl-carrier-protein] synthase III n=1 Tax=Ruminococcus albus 8 TaxID=246199 RepID=E9S9X8_RUMAL|nr:beta-ketoacyl-ACP synthase III [Ruminococcus albus]EGC03822.1 beta-ketoacyl-acyl-carrier-protein synthase III [Ruminococcus albus 8]MCC3350539.1 ketoacyl-ACP synthase III [Ruminococcus albus 8]